MPRRLAALAALSLLLFLPGLWARDFWAPDEPRYAQVTRETLEDGHWLLPHLNGAPYPDKPPMFFWLAAAMGTPFGGVHEASARLVPALAALGTVLLTYAFGRRLFGEEEGFWGAMILATSGKFLWQAQWFQIDMLLTFFETAAMLLLWSAASETREARLLSPAEREKRFWMKAGAALCLAAALLSKGPVGLIPAGVLLLWFLLRRDARGLARSGLLWCALIASALVVLWLLAADRWGGEPYSAWNAFSRHVVERASEGMHHKRPWHYYFPNFAMGFFPWTLFLLAALWSPPRRHDRGGESWFFLLLWFGFVFALFSAAAEKRDLYILPLYPPAALMTARFLLQHGGEFRRGATAMGALLAMLWGAAGGALLWMHLRGGLPWELPASVLPLAVLCLASGLLLGGNLSRAGRVIPAVAAWSLAASLLFAFHYAPALNAFKSPRPVAQKASEMGLLERPLASYPAYFPTFFYSFNRRAEVCRNEEELREFFRRHPGGAAFSAPRDAAKREKLSAYPVLLEMEAGGSTALFFGAPGWGGK
jgi:4-amino-4-deoxy-L-arabinose transferase-like glycosyltransferase